MFADSFFLENWNARDKFTISLNRIVIKHLQCWKMFGASQYRDYALSLVGAQDKLSG